jgi:hypothetical protein
LVYQLQDRNPWSAGERNFDQHDQHDNDDLSAGSHVNQFDYQHGEAQHDNDRSAGAHEHDNDGNQQYNNHSRRIDHDQHNNNPRDLHRHLHDSLRGWSVACRHQQLCWWWRMYLFAASSHWF